MGAALVVSTGLAQNHSEDLYVSQPVPLSATLNVSVAFAGGFTTMGGTVSAVDVAGAETPFVDGYNTSSGHWSGTAYSNVTTAHANDLLLLGVSGMGRDAPLVAGSGEALLDTGTGTSGPSTDGTGFGTFSASESGTTANLTATLATPAEWETIGLGILGCSGCSASGVTITPPVHVLAGSAVFLFVGYVNSEIGGGYVSGITDSLGDTYTLVDSTGFLQNHTEALYETGPIPKNATLNVSVSFAGGATSMGGSVAVVDVVAQSGTPTLDDVYVQAEPGGSVASVNVTTSLPQDLLLLGVSGPLKVAPFVEADGETLLNTGGNTSGPFEDGEGFGTFSAAETGARNELSATLATPAEWAAIGIGIYSWVPSGVPGATTTPAIGVVEGSALFLFVGYVDSVAGGGHIASVSDTLGDTYTLVNSTGLVQNHSESLYVAAPIAENASLTVSVTFAGGETTMGGSVAAVDVVTTSGILTIDEVHMTSGAWSGTAAVSGATHHSNDLLLLGVAGMGRGAPLTASPGETLLDTGTNTSGPFDDGTGFGTFSASETGTNMSLSATLATPTEWTAIGVGIFSASQSPEVETGLGDVTALGAGSPFAAIAANRPA